jgi:hypothetical protein
VKNLKAVVMNHQKRFMGKIIEMTRSNPYLTLLKPLKKRSRFKTTRKIDKKKYKLWSTPGQQAAMPCKVAQNKARRLRQAGYSVRIQKRRNGCLILIRKKER